MNLSARDRKALEEIQRLFLDLEKSSGDFSFAEADLKHLKQKIRALELSENSAVIRLADSEKHLVPNMTLKHFVSFVIPIERLLHKNLRDDEFLIIENDKNQIQHEGLPLVFVLDNIRSAFNVGSIFRTAECLQVKKIFLCGYTPNPELGKVEKTAMGTQNFITWEECPKIQDCLEKLKSEGYRLVALETAASALDLFDPFFKQPTAFILGNERFGIDPVTLSLVDEIRIIPLRGHKNSLNVGVTAAVAGFEWMRQWRI